MQLPFRCCGLPATKWLADTGLFAGCDFGPPPPGISEFCKTFVTSRQWTSKALMACFILLRYRMIRLVISIRGLPTT